MNLNLIAGSFSGMGFLLSSETIRTNQLWTQPFHKSYFRAVLRRVPRLIRVLPQTRQTPAPLPKRNWAYWFCSVIIIAFINTGWKTEQSPTSHFTPRTCVCAVLLVSKYERAALFDEEIIYLSSWTKDVNFYWIGLTHCICCLCLSCGENNNPWSEDLRDLLMSGFRIALIMAGTWARWALKVVTRVFNWSQCEWIKNSVNKELLENWQHHYGPSCKQSRDIFLRHMKMEPQLFGSMVTNLGFGMPKDLCFFIYF